MRRRSAGGDARSGRRWPGCAGGRASPAGTATARGSWRSWWPPPSMMRRSASPWASASTRASKTGTASSSEPCMTSSGRSAERGDVVDRAHRPRPRGPSRRTSGGNAGSWMMPDLAGVQQQAARVVGPVVEVGGRRHRGDAADLRVARRGADGQRAARAEAADPHVADIGLGAHERHRREQVVEPAVEGEVAVGLPATPEREDQHLPPELGGDAIGQLGERPGRQGAGARLRAGSRGRGPGRAPSCRGARRGRAR